LKKKGLYRVFIKSPRFQVDPMGWPIYFGPIVGLDFEWNKLDQPYWVLLVAGPYTNWVLLEAGANCIRSCWTTGPTTIESCWVVEPKAIRSCWAVEPNRIGSGCTTRIKDVRSGFRSQTQLAPLKEPIQFDLATNCRSGFWMK